MKLFALALLAFGLTNSKQLNCPSGEVPDVNNVCIQPRFIQGCHQYATTLTCAQCQYKYKLNQSGICQYQKETLEPCCLEKENNRCSKCNTGLVLTENGSCKQNSLLGCLQKDWKGNCKNCASDYLLVNGACSPGIKDCENYLKDSSAQTCVKCKANYSLVNNACLKNKILGCSYEKDHKCQKCLSPFKIKGDHCQITNCLTYNDFGCTACECGYFLNANYTCDQIQPGCIRYERGICTDCQSHFKLRGGICVIQGCDQIDFLTCIKCTDNYELSNGGCKLKNCFQWDQGVCHACDLGYATKQGKCIRDSKNLLVEN